MAEHTTKRQVNKVAATGRIVADNIKRLRLRSGMQYKKLSQRLSELGRPIAPLGLRKIEECERKVDVDDLTAFAAVFDVSPLEILMPTNGYAIDKSEITGYPTPLPNSYIWSWALGERPLNEEDNSIITLLLRRVDVLENRDIPPDVQARKKLGHIGGPYKVTWGYAASEPATEVLQEVEQSEQEPK